MSGVKALNDEVLDADKCYNQRYVVFIIGK